jgi:hypothetical protein
MTFLATFRRKIDILANFSPRSAQSKPDGLGRRVHKFQILG